MAVKEKQADSTEDIDWNVENEIQLFFAMNGHKPVGVNKYFHMVCIWEKFRAAIQKDVSLKAIWDHLKTMYDLMTLDELEEVPFPSNETDFVLPDNEFSELVKSRKKDETDVKPKDIKEKMKEVKKEKDVKDVKKEIGLRDSKGGKDMDKKKEETKKVVKEVEVKKESKPREAKDTKKEQKSTKGRSKVKEELDDSGPPMKKERKDSESSRESSKRTAPKRPTRQTADSASKASSSPRDTPPLKRRRI